MKPKSDKPSSPWTIGKARQHFSALLKAAERGPQEIYNRRELKAVVVNPEDYRKALPASAGGRPQNLFEATAEIREIARVTGWRFPRIPKRRNRPNALLKRLTGRSR